MSFESVMRSAAAGEVPRLPFRKLAIIGGLSILFLAVQPFATVQTGYRGVITQFGAIKDIKPEGLVILFPWEKLTSFNVRAETAHIEKAEGSTSDTQPVHVGMTVRYSILPDKVAEVFEKYSRDGDLSSYVQTATMESFKAVTARLLGAGPDLEAHPGIVRCLGSAPEEARHLRRQGREHRHDRVFVLAGLHERD